MKISPEIYLGIDLTAGRNPYTWAAIDEECQQVILKGGELDEVLTFLGSHESAMVAVNAPPKPNRGLVRAKLVQEQGFVNPRGADLRIAEYFLRERGISIPPTASRSDLCPAWIQVGFELHHTLDDLGFKLFPSADSPRQKLETNPHAVFCVLLGQHPLPKPTLEGRLQRQAILHDRGVGMVDPMEFFEEVTRHKLLHGSLPMEFIYAPEELDALAAAFTAWAAINTPTERSIIGDKEEGQLILPASELKEKYM